MSWWVPSFTVNASLQQKPHDPINSASASQTHVHVGDPLPTNVQMHSSALDSSRGHLYFSGGNIIGTPSNLDGVWRLDVEKMIVTSAPPLPSGLYGHSSFVLDDRLHILGGMKDNEIPNSSVYTLDLGDDGSNTWTTSAIAKYPKHACQYSPVGLNHHDAYIFGGGLYWEWIATNATTSFNIGTYIFILTNKV